MTIAWKQGLVGWGEMAGFPEPVKPAQARGRPLGRRVRLPCSYKKAPTRLTGPCRLAKHNDYLSTQKMHLTRPPPPLHQHHCHCHHRQRSSLTLPAAWRITRSIACVDDS
jgi:hypothetical protein